MRFKTIYILFNAVIVLSFAFIFLMPLVMLGRDYFSVFVSRNWIAGGLFVATLLFINVYFLYNWRLFRLLEKEDWKGLTEYLENRVYRRNALRRGYIRMLLNAYLVTSNLDKITALEEHLGAKRSRLLKEFALQFGIPHLLKNNPQEAEVYFGRFLEERGVRHREWLRWNYGFSLLQQRQLPAARQTLLQLLERKPEPVLRLLTLYLLSSFSGSEPELEKRVEKERQVLAARYTAQQWDRKVEASGRHIQMILLSPIIHEARQWLLPDSKTVH
jgi:hypothetical protein